MEFLKQLLYTLGYLIILSILPLWVYLLDADSIPIAFYGMINIIISLSELLVVLIFLRFQKIPWFPGRTHYRFYLAAVALGFLFIFVQDILNGLYNGVFQTTYNTHNDFDFKNILHWNIISVIIIYPIIEELLFRRFQLAKLLEKYPIPLAMIMNAVLFAVLHFPFDAIIQRLFYPSLSEFSIYYPLDFHHAYIAFFGGLLAAWIYTQSKSVGPSIAFHMAWNFMAMLA